MKITGESPGDAGDFLNRKVIGKAAPLYLTPSPSSSSTEVLHVWEYRLTSRPQGPLGFKGMGGAWGGPQKSIPLPGRGTGRGTGRRHPSASGLTALEIVAVTVFSACFREIAYDNTPYQRLGPRPRSTSGRLPRRDVDGRVRHFKLG